MPSLQKDGYNLHRQILSEPEIEDLCKEAERVATTAGATCVRHLREKSPLLANLPFDPWFQEILPPGLSPVRSILFDNNPLSPSWAGEAQRRPLSDPLNGALKLLTSKANS
jgi:hypothetical protein